MTLRLGGPFPAMETYSHFPNPEFGDSEAATQSLDRKRSINNVRYTYVKRRNQRRRISFRFDLTQAKAFEMIEFIRAYHSTPIQVLDHLGQTWVGNITTNPNEVESQAKAIKNAEAMYGHANIQIEFEGIKQ